MARAFLRSGLFLQHAHRIHIHAPARRNLDGAEEFDRVRMAQEYLPAIVTPQLGEEGWYRADQVGCGESLLGQP